MQQQPESLKKKRKKRQNSSFALILVFSVIVLGSFTLLQPKGASVLALQSEATENAGDVEPTTDYDTVDLAAKKEITEFSAESLERLTNNISSTFGYDEDTERISLSDIYTEPVEIKSIPDDIDWAHVAQLAGIGDAQLLEKGFRLGNIPRNYLGQPANNSEKGKLFPWNVIVAISYSETNTDAWDNIDPRAPGPWGYSLGYTTANSFSDPAMATACIKGLDAIAAAPDVQETWPGITGNQIYTSENCAVGKTQVLAVHFAPGQMLAGQLHKNLWNNREAIIEATITHLVAKKSKKCGDVSWFWTESLDTALCSYNPSSWGKASDAWYFEGIHKMAATIDAALAQALSELEAKRSDPNKRISAPCRGCRVSLNFGTYPNWPSLARLGLTGLLHKGTDFVVDAPAGGFATFNTYAMFTGQVIRCELTYSAGLVITIQSAIDPSWTVTYMHQDANSGHVAYGQQVNEGDIIGLSNGSGKYSDGSHLHLELTHEGKLLDPMQFISWP